MLYKNLGCVKYAHYVHSMVLTRQMHLHTYLRVRECKSMCRKLQYERSLRNVHFANVENWKEINHVRKLNSKKVNKCVCWKLFIHMFFFYSWFLRSVAFPLAVCQSPSHSIATVKRQPEKSVGKSVCNETANHNHYDCVQTWNLHERKKRYFLLFRFLSRRSLKTKMPYIFPHST